MKLVYSDGGRSQYFKGLADDCVCRAICNATGIDYKVVYDAINEKAKAERKSARKSGKSSARNGVYKNTTKKVIEEWLGWQWHSMMQIGEGCKVHLDPSELPSGNLIVQVTRHLTCVKDGVIYDTFDPSRDGTRCVYGYWTPKEKGMTQYEWEHLKNGERIVTDGGITMEVYWYDYYGEGKKEMCLLGNRSIYPASQFDCRDWRREVRK